MLHRARMSASAPGQRKHAFSTSMNKRLLWPCPNVLQAFGERSRDVKRKPMVLNIQYLLHHLMWRQLILRIFPLRFTCTEDFSSVWGNLLQSSRAQTWKSSCEYHPHHPHYHLTSSASPKRSSSSHHIRGYCDVCVQSFGMALEGCYKNSNGSW